jgi:hypothetical protein
LLSYSVFADRAEQKNPVLLKAEPVGVKFRKKDSKEGKLWFPS